MLQRTNQIRCTEGIIDDEGDAMLVGHSGYAFEIKHITDVYNRSSAIYNDTYFGAWTDFDIGYAWDGR